MGVNIAYDGECKMVFRDMACACPLEHNAPAQDIYVGENLIDKLPAYIRARGLGVKCVLVCDNNTYDACGRRALGALEKDGFSVTLCMLERAGNMVPDERAVGEATLSLSRDTEFMIAVGSGSVTDVTRATAAAAKLKFVSVGTAPSMDGYTSVVAPLVFRGAKVHRQADCPEIIVCDLGVMRTAPASMFVSGVGDVLGKFIAKADWALGNIINGEVICPMCADIVMSAARKLIDNIDEIRERTLAGTKILIEALLLAGLTIMIVGHTRAVASIEHNIAHYWDMRALGRGMPEPSHGQAVGVATLLVWPLFEKFAREDLSGFDKSGVFEKRMSRDERVSFMLGYYGEAAGRDIIEHNPGDFLTREAWEARVDAALERVDDIRAELSKLPPLESIRSAMARLGAPLTPDDVGVPPEDVRAALICAKDYRERYTLFKLLDELGLLEAYIA